MMWIILTYEMTLVIHNARMRQSKEEKAKSHERIVGVAAARVRESGLDGPGVAEIMGAAGLTHGGFYKHFESREELIAEAVDRALADGRDAMADAIAEADDPLRAFVAWYLSPGHVEDRGAGCAVAALGCDIARAGTEPRRAFTEQTEHYIDALERLLGSDGGSRERAVASVAALVGALILARAVDDPELSRELLDDVRSSIAGPAEGSGTS
jgi:TetR/AcrR family transcriptional regulator, transcriptional repressor for nem operon